MRIVFRANVREPDRTRIAIARGLLFLHPGPRQRMVDHRDLVMEQVGIGLVEIDALLDDGLTVAVERHPRNIIAARQFEEARLYLEHVILAVAVLVDPLAD